MYRTQKWPLEVMREALRIRSQGHSIRATAAKLAETVSPAPTWHTVRSWTDCTIKRAAALMENYPMPKLTWRSSGHLSNPDAGHALCGAPVRFQAEVEAVSQSHACAACLLRAESGSREFKAPIRREHTVQDQLRLEVTV